MVKNTIDVKEILRELDTTRIKDYPLMSGKEILLRTNFKGCCGMPSQISQLNLKEQLESC